MHLRGNLTQHISQHNSQTQITFPSTDKYNMSSEKQYYTYDNTSYVLAGSFISPLGYLMIRFYDEEKKVWMNVNLGSFEELLLKKQTPKNPLQ